MHSSKPNLKNSPEISWWSILKQATEWKSRLTPQPETRLGCYNSQQISGTLHDLLYPGKFINHCINSNGGWQGSA